MTSPLNLGFIGGSLKSAVGYVHYAASRMDGLWHLAAGAFSRNAAQNAETGARWGVEPGRQYARWQDMLAAEAHRLDAWVVLTPTPSHSEIVCALLKAGVPVICEKALATSVEEAECIREAQAAKGAFLQVTFNYSGYPMVRELRGLIAAGRLGAIRHVQLEMPQEGYLRLDPQGRPVIPQAWRLQDYRVHTVSLDLGVHLHHLMHFLTGQTPLEVMADVASYGHHQGVADNITCWVNYGDDLRCAMWYSKSALGQRNGLRIRVFGEKGSAEWLQTDPQFLHLAFADGSRQILDRGGNLDAASDGLPKLPRYNRFKSGHPSGFIEAFANLYADLAEGLLEHRQTGQVRNPWLYGLDHATEGLRLFEAAARSAAKRGWEPV